MNWCGLCSQAPIESRSCHLTQRKKAEDSSDTHFVHFQMLSRVIVCSERPSTGLLNLLLPKLIHSTHKYLQNSENKSLTLRVKLMGQTWEGRAGNNSPTLLRTLLKTTQKILSPSLAGMLHQPRYEVTEHFERMFGNVTQCFHCYVIHCWKWYKCYTYKNNPSYQHT